jgi:hypothetical protein
MIQPRMPAQKIQIPRDRSNDKPGDVSSIPHMFTFTLTLFSALFAAKAKIRGLLLSVTLATLRTIVSALIHRQDLLQSRIGTVHDAL